MTTLNPAVQQQVEQFLALAREFIERRQDAPWPASLFSTSPTTPRHRYLYVSLPGFYFLVHKETGAVYTTQKNVRHVGHISDFLRRRDWRRGNIVRDDGCPRLKSRVCGGCSRTANVRDTTVGPRCQYCRGADSRHISSVRQLGGIPTHNGQPIVSYLQG